MPISGFHSLKTAKPKRKLVCLFSASEGRAFLNGHHISSCESRSHRHHTVDEVIRMKKQGIVQWIGTKQRHAVFAAGRDWEKTYLRTPLGATFICTMQLKETGGMLGKPAKPKTNISHARNGKVVEIAVPLEMGA